MKAWKILCAAILVIFLAVPALSYDGSGSGSNPAGTECNNEADDDLDGLVDGDDPGCTRPYDEDDSEGNIWDTDLTIDAVGGESNINLAEDYTVFFEGKVLTGESEIQDTHSGPELNEQYVDIIGPAGSGSYGGGANKTKSYSQSNFASGTVFFSDEGRAVDPPNPYGTPQWNEGGAFIGDRTNCGDGYMNSLDDPSPSDITITNDHQDDGIDCRADYGRLLQEKDHNSEYKQDELTCRTDDGCSSSAECTGRCGGSASASCNDYSEDNGNDYWVKNDGGQGMQKFECEEYGGSVTSDSATCSDSWTTCSGSGESLTCTTNSCGPVTYEASAGDYREFKEKETINCNQHNVVDGGGDDGGSESDHYSEEYRLKPDNDPAGTFTDFKSYGQNSDRDQIWCQFESTLTVDADGPKGYGDGWVVFHDGEIVANEAPNGESTVGQRVLVDGSFSGTNYLNDVEDSTSCPSGVETCLKYIDFYTVEGSGSPGSPEWETEEGAVTHRVVGTGKPRDSYSVCKNINRIWRQQHGLDDSKRLKTCDMREDPDDGGSSGTTIDQPPPEPGEFWVYMEGPEINQEQFELNRNHFQGNVDNINDCIIKGKEVSEGHVANVAPSSSADQYEKGANSEDWEVCLNIDSSGLDDPGDDMAGDNYCMSTGGTIDNEAYENNNCGPGASNYRDAGGEWYDLDSELAQEYLRGSGNGLISDTDPDNSSEIAYYWRDNQNPQHPTHNPEGRQSGTALENDCGNPRFGDNLNCDDQEELNDRGHGQTDSFYSFFNQGKRDEDLHPQGNDASTSDRFQGFVNKVEDLSNQLQPGMDTSTYNMPDTGDSATVSLWRDSRGGVNTADQWAFTEDMSWSISSRGVPYPSFATYYRDSTNARTSPSDTSVAKYLKVFGNSYAAVAANSFDTEHGSAEAGDGVWLDPDDLEKAYGGTLAGESGTTVQLQTPTMDWRDEIKFRMDLTGPDSGIGVDTGDSSSLEFRSTGPTSDTDTVFGDIYFEGEEDGVDNDGDGTEDEDGVYSSPSGSSVGESVPKLEAPVCGDDRKEFLIEELGESRNTEEFDGEYACSDQINSCVDSEGTPQVVQEGTYRNVDEPDEEVGRSKNDREMCGSLDASPSDPRYTWIDQDYGDIDGDGEQETCVTNTFYRDKAKDWFSSDYVQSYPEAVKYGIDDDWNTYLENLPHPDRSGSSPVATGSPNKSIATVGFCGGDDSGEFYVTQRCSTRLCDTNLDVRGVVKTPGACILDGSNYDAVSSNERDTYRPGEEVTFDFGGETREIRCYGGRWYEDWPIVAEEDNMVIEEGDTENVHFYVVNPTSNDQTFNLEIEDSEMKSLSEFASSDTNERTVDVDARESVRVAVEATGGDTTIDNAPVSVQAVSQFSDLNGEASTNIDVVEQSDGAGSSSPNEVPGIGAVQLLALALTAASAVLLS